MLIEGKGNQRKLLPRLLARFLQLFSILGRLILPTYTRSLGSPDPGQSKATYVLTALGVWPQGQDRKRVV